MLILLVGPKGAGKLEIPFDLVLENEDLADDQIVRLLAPAIEGAASHKGG